MYKLNFTISLNTFTELQRYAKSLSLSVPTVIKFLLAEKSVVFINNKNLFIKNFNSCKYKETIGSTNAYGKLNKPKKYSLEVSEYIYNIVLSIKEEFKIKTNEVVNNMIHMGLSEKLYEFKNDYANAIPYKNIESVSKQFNIPISNIFYEKLNDISEITDIRINRIISLIIGNYLIEHYKDFFDGQYYDDTDERFYHYGIWQKNK